MVRLASILLILSTSVAAADYRITRDQVAQRRIPNRGRAACCRWNGTLARAALRSRAAAMRRPEEFFCVPN